MRIISEQIARLDSACHPEENKSMHIRNATLILMLGTAGWAAAQAPAGGNSTANPPAPAAPAAVSQAAAPATAADLLQPSLTNARETLTSLKLDKWKKGTVREEAETNVSALLRDLNDNMQPLLTAADAAPGQLSKAIPLIKHLDAFYDVLLRVEEASRVSAPSDQIDALQQALLRVSQARIAYDDVLQSQAAGEEKQIVDLQAAVRAEQENAKLEEHKTETRAAATQPCKPAAPAHRRRRTSAAKPKSTPSTAPSQPATKPQ